MNKNKQTLRATFETARQNYTKKDFKTAEIYCYKILSIDPNHFDSLSLLANIFAVSRNFSKSKELLEKAKLLKTEKLVLKEEDFEAVLQNRDPLKYGTCYVQKGSFGYEPMCAIYEPKFIVPLFEAMSRRELSLSRIIAGSASIEALPFKKLKIDELDRSKFMNINTTEDYEKRNLRLVVYQKRETL